MARKKKGLRSYDISDGKGNVYHRVSPIVYESEPQFVKLYIENSNTVLSKQAGMIRLLVLLADDMDYTNKIRLSPLYRKELAEKIGVKTSSINQLLYLLNRDNLIYKRGENEYIVNPNYLAKGDYNDIKRLVQKINKMILDNEIEALKEKESMPIDIELNNLSTAIPK